MAAAAAAAVKRRLEVEAAIAAGDIHPVCLGGHGAVGESNGGGDIQQTENQKMAVIHLKGS